MAEGTLMGSENCVLVLPASVRDKLWQHLFPGDDDEHGAVIAAGMAKSSRGLRLLAREVFLAKDGVDYVPGKRGYRMLRADFIREKVLYCRDRGLAYIAVHNHGGISSVGFSPDDLASHERGYPALLDVSRGLPLGAIVVARRAVAGDIWFARHSRLELEETKVIGVTTERLYAHPPARPSGRAAKYDRQARLFGDRGQDLLSKAKVGIIGAGGVGSLISEQLARLGVGWLVVADPDKIDITNLPRVVGSTRWDARTSMTEEGRPEWVRRLGTRLAATKVTIARRVARTANPRLRFDALPQDFTYAKVAREFADCDFLFLAADSMQARLVFNALVHQYLIPGVQVGAKIRVSESSGEVLDVFSVSRPVTPDSGCLWCNGLISPDRLQQEAATKAERKAQNYLNEPEVTAPSVITLNSSAVGHAVNDFLFSFTGLARSTATSEYVRIRPLDRSVSFDQPRADADCLECGLGDGSRRGMGDRASLPTRE
jgi:hypothetical protein